MNQVNTDKLKVIHLTSSSGLAGGERYLSDLIRHSAPSVEHSVILPRQGPFEAVLRNSGIAYAVVDMSRKFSPATLSALITKLRACGPHILHTHGYRSNFYGRLAAMALGIRHMATVHVSLFDYRNTPNYLRILYLLAERLLAAKTRIFICVSQAIYTDLIKLGLPKHKLRVIPNGVDLQRFHPRPVSEDEKSALGLSGPGPVIGCVGRLVEEKGQKYLIDSLLQLKTRWPDLRCVFVGEGPLEGTLKDRAERLGVDRLCRFWGVRSDVEELYAYFDVFVLPSVREPFGIVLLEAMASGLPVVATAVGGPLDFISHGINGNLVPPRKAGLLALEIKHLLNNRQLAEDIKRSGLRTVSDGFDVRNTTRKTEETYLSIV